MSFQSRDTRVDDDLTLLSETLEEVLRSSGDPADQKYIELKARAEQALHDVKTASVTPPTIITTAPNRRFIVPTIMCMKTVAGHWGRCGRRAGAGSAVSPSLSR